jgi:hypothetical protein
MLLLIYCFAKYFEGSENFRGHFRDGGVGWGGGEVGLGGVTGHHKVETETAPSNYQLVQLMKR